MLRRKGDTDRTDPNAPTTMFEIARTGLALDEAGGRYSQDTRVTAQPGSGIHTRATRRLSVGADPVPC